MSKHQTICLPSSSAKRNAAPIVLRFNTYYHSEDAIAGMRLTLQNLLWPAIAGAGNGTPFELTYEHPSVFGSPKACLG
jgi:hypothetical protein